MTPYVWCLLVLLVAVGVPLGCGATATTATWGEWLASVVILVVVACLAAAAVRFW